MEQSEASLQRRSLFFPRLEHDVEYRDLIRMANRYGRVLSVKIVRPGENKNQGQTYAFINFVTVRAARSCYKASQEGNLAYQKGASQFNGAKIRPAVEFAKPMALPADIAKSIKEGATRNLYVAGLGSGVSERQLRDLFLQHVDGFESVIIHPSKAFAFVNSSSVVGAIKAKDALQNLEIGPGVRLRINFAKENVRVSDGRGGTSTKPTIEAVLAARAEIPPTITVDGKRASKSALLQPAVGFVSPQMNTGIIGQPLVLMTDAERSKFPSSLRTGSSRPPRVRPGGDPSRGIYLGNLLPQVTYHDLCRLGNTCGPLESIKILPHKSCAFLNFVHAEHAHTLHAIGCEHGLSLHGNDLLIGWANVVGGLKDALARRIGKGATRNVFLGNLDRQISEVMLCALLKSSCQGHCQMESMVINRDHHFAFVNLTSVESAILVVDALGGGVVFDGREIVVGFAAERIHMCPAFVAKGSGPFQNSGPNNQNRNNPIRAVSGASASQLSRPGSGGRLIDRRHQPQSQLLSNGGANSADGNNGNGHLRY